MKKSNLFTLLSKVESVATKNGPAILAGIAAVGAVITMCTAFKAGMKATKILENHQRDINDCDPDDMETKKAVMTETVKKMVPVVVPPLVMGGATVACIVGSHTKYSRKLAALSAAYNLSETTVKNLNSKMEEMLGEKKARAVRDSIMKDKLRADKDHDQKVEVLNQISMPGNGDVLCKDLYTGRPFYSSYEKISQAIAKCSYDMVSDMYISLNDFYEAIDSKDLPPVPLGNDFGWNIDDTQNGKLPIYLTAILTESGKPCLCVEYDIGVRHDFRNLH